MNCSRFRFLIQQWFDSPLSVQDERMVLAHVEQCDSCARFQHQLDQVIQSAPEVPLPDECLPANLEALAKRIINEMPQQKPGLGSLVEAIFPFFKNISISLPKPKKQAKPQPSPEEQADSLGGSMFPHIRRGDARSAKKAPAVDEELLATSTRLRNQKQRFQAMEEAQAQSQGQSLGTKFGVNVPIRDQGGAEDGPLTLAESIRRKVVEEKQQDAEPAPLAEPSPTFAKPADAQFGGGQQYANPSQQFGAPQSLGGYQQQTGAPMVGQWGEPIAPANQQTQGQRQPFSEPPLPGVGGDSDWRPSAPGSDWQIAKPQTSAWSTSGQPQQPSGWGSAWPESQPAAQAPGNEWAQTAPQQPQSWSDEQTRSGGQSWGAPPAQSSWSSPAQAPRQDSGWGQAGGGSGWQTQGGNGQWGQAQSGQPAADVQNAANSTQSQGWGHGTAFGGYGSSGFGQSAQPQTLQTGGQPPEDSYAGQTSGGWGQPSAFASQAQSWPNTAGGDTAGAQQGSAGWANTQPQPPASWDPAASQSAFGQQSQMGGADQNSGSNPFLSSTPAPSTNQFLTSAPAPAAAGGAFDAWSEEGEQIQTGMWQAFTLAEPELGQPKSQQMGQQRPTLPRPGQPVDQPGLPSQQPMSAPPPPPAVPGTGSLYDLSIQDRMRLQQGQPAAAMRQPVPPVPGAPPPPAPAPVPPVPPVAAVPPVAPMGSMAQAPLSPPPPPQPPAPMAAPPGAVQGKHSIMDRLNKVLGDDLTAMAKSPNEAPAPVAAPPPAPYAAAPTAPASAPASAPGLFRLDDKAIDKVFKENLGVSEPARPVGGAEVASPAPPPPPVAPPVVPQAPAYAQPPAAQGPKISAVPPRQPAGAMQPPAQSTAADGSLFRLDDKAIDKVFKENLGVKDASQQPVNPGSMPPQQAAPPAPSAGASGVPSAQPAPPAVPQPAIPQPAPPVPGQQPGWGPPAPPPPMPQPMPAPPPAAPTARANQAGAAPPAKSSGGLFNVDDDAMDRIFADLGVKEKSAALPKINVREAVQQIRTLSDVPTPPKVDGIGRLSPIEMVSEPSLGKINAIGKFLLDQQDLAKIGRLTEQDLNDTKVRVLTHEASDEINRLLEHIATQPGVVGSVIVGHDGILIANSLPREHDPETIGILSLGIYINTTNSTKKIGHNHLFQLVCRTQAGYLVIADFGGGILVTVSNALETEKLIPLMRSITQLVAQT